MKKFKYINMFFYIIEIIFIIGTIVLADLVKSKMGVARHIVYINSKIKNYINMRELNVYIIFIIIAVVIFINIYLDKKIVKKKNKILNVKKNFIKILSLIFVIFRKKSLFLNPQMIYMIVILICILITLEILRKLINLFFIEKEKKEQELYE